MKYTQQPLMSVISFQLKSITDNTKFSIFDFG